MAMFTKEPSTTRAFASSACGFTLRIHKRLPRCVVDVVASSPPINEVSQIFCQEAVMWNRLTHPNIVPLLGVTIEHFQLISNWMSGGDLLSYIKKNSDADRLGLVGISPIMLILRLLPLSAIRCCRGPPLPPLLQRHPWGPQGST